MERTVVKPAVFQPDLGGDDRDLGNNDEPLDPWVADVGTGADRKVDAEQDERDEHPLEGEDLPEDGEGREEAGKISGSADERGNHIHDAQQKPGIPLERPGQYHPIAKQEAECRKEEHQYDVDQPAGEVGRIAALRHQLHLRRMHPAQSIAINDGERFSRPGVKGLANQPGHSDERNSIDGNHVVFGLHARAFRLRLNRETGVAGVVEWGPRAVGIEKAVEDRCRAGRIKERRTHNQYGQQQIRKFGEVRLHGPHKAFLLFQVIWQDSPGAAILWRNGRVQNSLLEYANSKNASGGMVADRRLTSGRDAVSFLIDMQVRTHHHRHHHHHVTSVSADGSGQQ